MTENNKQQSHSAITLNKSSESQKMLSLMNIIVEDMNNKNKKRKNKLIDKYRNNKKNKGGNEELKSGEESLSITDSIFRPSSDKAKG